MRRLSAAPLVLLLALAACAGQPGPTSSATPAPASPSATAAPAPSASALATSAPAPSATPAPAATAPAATAPPLAAGSSVARVVYMRNAGGQLELRSASLDGGDDRLLTALPSERFISAVAVAPDGQTVAYVAAGPDQPAALSLITAGGDERPLLEHRPDIALVGFSPDGAQLAYVRYRPTESMGVDGAIWVVSLADGAHRELVPRVFPLGPVAWRDPQTLLYSASDAMGQLGGVFAVGAAGDTEPQLLTPGVLRALSPDGTQLLVGTEAIGHDIIADQTFAHALMALDGSAAAVIRELSLTAGGNYWSPDGTTIAHVGAGLVELIDVASGDSRSLLRYDDRAAGWISAVSWGATAGELLYAVVFSSDAPSVELRRLATETGEELAQTQIPGALAATIAVARTDVLSPAGGPGASEAVRWQGLEFPLPPQHRWEPGIASAAAEGELAVVDGGRVRFVPGPQMHPVEQPDGVALTVVAFDGSLEEWLAQEMQRQPQANPIDRASVRVTTLLGEEAIAYSATVTGVSRTERMAARLDGGRLLLVDVSDADNPAYQRLLAELRREQ